ncbi:OmpA family protein [Acidisoma sp.]|uniref:OmpA family protein n=1 Tax=Acidisoma sp. TaxID=1872115 RepID=UPI003B009D05
MKAHKIVLAVGTAMIAASTVAMAQTPNPAAPKPETPDAHTTTSPASSTTPTSAEAPTSLSVYFASGSSTLAPKEQATLDEASRIFNDGKPIVMIITGMADATGSAGPNLLLSQKRADIVFQGLIARGLPPNHFQILAAGTTASLSGKEPSGPDQAYRKVEITWR